jgi:hypothetical protein
MDFSTPNYGVAGWIVARARAVVFKTFIEDDP